METKYIEIIMEEKNEKGMSYPWEWRPKFHDLVVLGFLWTEKLARQIDFLSLGVGEALGLSWKLRREEEESSLTVINIFIYYLGLTHFASYSSISLFLVVTASQLSDPTNTQTLPKNLINMMILTKIFANYKLKL